MWSTPTGERYDFAGEHYRLESSPALPKPVQRRVPVIVGGGGAKKTPGLAARYAAEFNSGFVTPERHSERASRVRDACEAIGRDPGTLVFSVAGTTAGGQTRAAAERRAEKAGSTVDYLASNGFAGTAQQIVERIGTLSELGFSRIYFQVMDMHDLEHLDFLALEVVAKV